MDVVGHHDKGTQPHEWKVIRNVHPTAMGQFAQIRSLHIPVNHRAEPAHSTLGTQGYEIGRVLSIIPKRRSTRTNSISILKPFHGIQDKKQYKIESHALEANQPNA